MFYLLFYMYFIDNDGFQFQLMAGILSLHKELGDLFAWRNWYQCLDINLTSDRFLSNRAFIESTEYKINSLKKILSRSLNMDYFGILLGECHEFMELSRESMERIIEAEHRPSGVEFNKKALVILTAVKIPSDVCIALSFGYKFQFPFYCNDQNMPEILAQLQMTVEGAIPFSRQLETSIDINLILKDRNRFQYDNNIRWLKFISNRTDSFLSNHPEIFATKSDKGGHTVVIDVSEYETKLTTLLSGGSYILLDQDPLHGLVDKEIFFISNLRHNSKTDKMFEHLPLFEPNVLCLAKFYGLPKIHKNDAPLRPITSTIGSPGYLLAKIFDLMLKEIFPRTPYHIKDSFEFTEFVQKVHIKDSDILVSFDVVSMFTSIPYELIKEIVLSQSDAFLKLFSIEKCFLVKMLEFLLQDCMIFTALDKIYKQLDGLPMGSCISPTMARIFMDKVIDNLLIQIPSISFIKVFVDDTIAAININQVDLALRILNDFRHGKIKFTLERENNENGSINFLNVTLFRVHNRIITKWFRKSFASGRLLNFFSSHKRTTVMQTAIHFIESVLLLSDPKFFKDNRSIVIQTLRDNSFPETTIISLMNSVYTYMRPLKNSWFLDSDNSNCIPYPPLEELVPSLSKPIQQSLPHIDGSYEDEKDGYVIFPHSICRGRRIKRILCNFKWPKVTLADSVRNTKVNSISCRKTAIPMVKRKNLILISRCQCKRKYRIVKTRFNETGELTLKRIITSRTICGKFSHAYSKVRFHRGLFYGSQTNYLLRYIQWRYRHKLDASQSGGYEFPNPHFCRLLRR